ncbi:MAG: hypothetical protein QXX38_01525 [Candidatus Aenigmatarchaeota archaeon]
MNEFREIFLDKDWILYLYDKEKNDILLFPESASNFIESFGYELKYVLIEPNHLLLLYEDQHKTFFSFKIRIHNIIVYSYDKINEIFPMSEVISVKIYDKKSNYDFTKNFKTLISEYPKKVELGEYLDFFDEVKEEIGFIVPKKIDTNEFGFRFHKIYSEN